MTLLVAALVIGGPLLAVVAGRVADAAALRPQRAERGWYQVPAVLLQSASDTISTDGQMDVAWVRARWTERSGRPQTGTVAAALNARAGQRVQIWLTAAGRQTYPRLDAAGIRDRVISAVALAAAGWCAVLGAASFGVRVVADRRRMAGWEQDWSAVGPRWSRQG